jgi:hypothetical protein
MASMADYKNRRKDNLDSLTKKLDAVTNNSKSYEDDRIWKLERDKAGNGYAVLRFLDAPKGEASPYIQVWHHGFQGPGGWYIENSLTTLNKKDPVSEANTRLWNSGVESDKDIARQRKRKLNYYSNVLVVEDPTNPQNNGKVMLFKYGKRIFDKVYDCLNPEFKDEAKINPFDFYDGVNFKMKVRMVEGYVNYDKSEFESSAKPIADTDEEIENIWDKCYSLQDFLGPDNFKSYDELEAKFFKVLGDTVDRTSTVEDDVAEAIEYPSATKEETPDIPFETETDEKLDYFKALANEDV